MRSVHKRTAVHAVSSSYVRNHEHGWVDTREAAHASFVQLPSSSIRLLLNKKHQPPCIKSIAGDVLRAVMKFAYLKTNDWSDGAERGVTAAVVVRL